MSDHTSGHRVKNARRGLATIAFLKARFDAGMDHLDMFQPFVEDAIRHYEEDDIDVAGVQGAVRDLTGLSIPADIVKTLLRRAAKKGLLTPWGRTLPAYAALRRGSRVGRANSGARTCPPRPRGTPAPVRRETRRRAEVGRRCPCGPNGASSTQITSAWSWGSPYK